MTTMIKTVTLRCCPELRQQIIKFYKHLPVVTDIVPLSRILPDNEDRSNLVVTVDRKPHTTILRFSFSGGTKATYKTLEITKDEAESPRLITGIIGLANLMHF